MSEIKVDPCLYHGAPADLSGRSEEEIETFLFLDRLGIPYDRVEHEPAMTIEACEAITDWLLSTEGQKFMTEGYMHSVLAGFETVPYDSVATDGLIEKDMDVGVARRQMTEHKLSHSCRRGDPGRIFSR